MARIPILLDVDPGNDDAVAIMLACGSRELEVRAVTTVAGNVPLPRTTDNALRVLSLIGRCDVPVAAGATQPLKRVLSGSAHIHGESGLGGVDLPEPTFEPDERHATQLMADVLERSAEPVTLVPTGPLTNVAALLAERPKLADRIRRIVLMGGSVGLGNVTPAAEMNAYTDPDAAQAVFKSGLPVTMVGLDVTHQALADAERRTELRATGFAGEVAANLLEFFAGRYKEVYNFDAPPVHDAVAVAAVVEPRILKTRPMRVEVECESALTRGETVCDLHGVWGKASNAEVGVAIDDDAFFKVLVSAFGRL